MSRNPEGCLLACICTQKDLRRNILICVRMYAHTHMCTYRHAWTYVRAQGVDGSAICCKTPDLQFSTPSLAKAFKSRCCPLKLVMLGLEFVFSKWSTFFMVFHAGQSNDLTRSRKCPSCPRSMGEKRANHSTLVMKGNCCFVLFCFIVSALWARYEKMYMVVRGG